MMSLKERNLRLFFWTVFGLFDEAWHILCICIFKQPGNILNTLTDWFQRRAIYIAPVCDKWSLANEV